MSAHVKKIGFEKKGKLFNLCAKQHLVEWSVSSQRQACVRSTGHAIIQNQSVSTALMTALLDNNWYLIGVATLTGMLLL